MNPIQELEQQIRSWFPDLEVELDAAEAARGSWFLDVQRGEDFPPVVIEWRSDLGFGISTPDGNDIGMKPDELYPDVNTAFDRVCGIVVGKSHSAPPTAIKLAELRARAGFTQAELAARAGVKQANISRIEGREDIRLSTLANFVAALGAQMAITVTLPNGSTVPLDLSQFGIEATAQS